MTRLCELNDNELVSRLECWRGKEHSATLLVLKYLSEVDTRKLYLGLGFSSLFAFCTERLKYSEGGAQRRVVAARCIREYPLVFEALKAKRVSLVTIGIFSKVLTETNVDRVLNAVSNLGKDKVEAYVSGLSNVASPPKEVIRAVLVRKPTELPLLVQSKPRAEATSMPLADPEADVKFKLGFYVNKETMDKLNRLKELRPYRTLEELFDTVLTDYIKKHDLRTKKAAPVNNHPDARYVPTALRALVLKRDDNQCCYVAPDGTRCSARHNLQIDHKVPFSIGGKTTESNLRTLCASHNQFEAKRVLGQSVIGYFSKQITATVAVIKIVYSSVGSDATSA